MRYGENLTGVRTGGDFLLVTDSMLIEVPNSDVSTTLSDPLPAGSQENIIIVFPEDPEHGELQWTSPRRPLSKKWLVKTDEY